jgi:hypothetical protein
MVFPWIKKVKPVPAQINLTAEVTQTVELPVLNDKISVIEHKNGEQVDCSRKEDDEDHEVQGVLQEGGRPQEGDHGSEEVMEETRGS